MPRLARTALSLVAPHADASYGMLYEAERAVAGAEWQRREAGSMRI